MKRLLVISIGLFCLFSFTLQNKEFNYLPKKVGNHQIVAHTEYTLSYNEKHEQADWVAYRLDSNEALVSTKRCDKRKSREKCFIEDDLVITGTATHQDYMNSGYDRGHLSPSADNKRNKAINDESFYMSNMSPQIGSFNRTYWRLLEEWVHERAIEYKTVYVVTGPVFKNNRGTIGKQNKITIPGYYYKVVLRFDDGRPEMIGFLMPHKEGKLPHKDYIVSVDSIESFTGLDFFPKLKNKTENRAEAFSDKSKWGLE